MNKFRKKPIVVEAMQYTFKNAETVRDWCGGCWYGDCAYHYSGKPIMFDSTLAINMAYPDENHQRYVLVREGDWVIKDIKGGFYPCTNDIFEGILHCFNNYRFFSEFIRHSSSTLRLDFEYFQYPAHHS